MSKRIAAHGVVVGVDGSPSSQAAVRWAAREAVLRHAGLTVVHVAESLPAVASTLDWNVGHIPEEVLEIQENTARSIIADAIAVARDSTGRGDGAEISGELMFGKPVPTLAELSEQAQVVVVGCRGATGWHRRLLGSVSTEVLHHAHCPVAVVHDEVTPSAQLPVLIGIDGSPTSERATEIAFDEASWRGVDLVALHVVSDTIEPSGFYGMEWGALRSTSKTRLTDRLADWQKRYPEVNVNLEGEFARPAHQLLTRAEQAQLVVLGSHGRGGFQGMLLGSVSTAVAQESRVPVIVARRH
jgi:nucleotide-binding universal stress UspA family protein